MNKDTIENLRKDLDKKFDHHVRVVQHGDDGGISTSKNLYLEALERWEDAWREYLAEQHSNNKNES